ncbi:hypothetical protein HBI56_131750 [Parastagonospora nodorum]|uniref:Uncharacterized protein n=1 Tax=Phaeosphaeria nodorum (strain SN15 / ATCC MYA-4574 / FGSC 10173) TaxID=321614 RepID=A0A7U2I1N7_PHANO|nr:hypothetical protein HBH54_165620 [Parastagonospora nodorum]QRC96117.1 hypothetical protein JI435_304060 [Parastagonospora nodorum SN15]KAH3940329.1 hypothetical protein HBH53_218560 [Parastagonospora nodorum]KAH3972012.1 hypothetical protein HBH51_107930 [Parastagonospora nodorum]KAH3996661.1 hypothetical protein HBI10_153670 [Parastagonospora nodorum]
MYLESLQPGTFVDEDSATCSTSAAHGPVLRYQLFDHKLFSSPGAAFSQRHPYR